MKLNKGKKNERRENFLFSRKNRENIGNCLINSEHFQRPGIASEKEDISFRFTEHKSKYHIIIFTVHKTLFILLLNI